MKAPTLLLLSLLIVPAPAIAQYFELPPDAPSGRPGSDDSVVRQLLPREIYNDRREEEARIRDMSRRERQQYLRHKSYEIPDTAMPEAPPPPPRDRRHRR